MMTLINESVSLGLCLISLVIFMLLPARRKIFMIMGLLVLGVMSCQKPDELPYSNEQPNIIFLLTDDQRDNTFGAMAHPFVHTPQIDDLINNGVRFSNTYIAEPVCSPSRVSLLTGMHERMHGVGFSSKYELTEEQWEQSYPALLRDNGYYTGFIGKIGIEYYTFRGDAAEKFDFWQGHDGWTKFFPKEYNNFSCEPYHDAENDIITPIMGEAITEFLTTAPDSLPFCLSVSFNVPHGSQTTSMYAGYEGWHSMLRPANENPKLQGHPIYDTLYRGMDLGVPQDVGSDPYQHIPKFILDQQEGRIKTYSYDYTLESAREHHVRYYQTITGMDSIVGNMMQTLEENGLVDNTIIIFASDHGLLMGEYGMGGKALLYDLTSKIPCFVYDPRAPQSQKGKTVDKLVSSLDIPATILNYAGVQVPDEMTGSSLVPLVHGEDVEWRDELFLESLFTLRDNPFCEGIRQGDWKYIRMYDGVVPYDEANLQFDGKSPDFEQLFNVKDDPEEKNNLIEAYQDSELLKSFRQRTAAYSDEMNKQRADYMQTHDISKREVAF